MGEDDPAQKAYKGISMVEKEEMARLRWRTPGRQYAAENRKVWSSLLRQTGTGCCAVDDVDENRTNFLQHYFFSRNCKSN